MVLKEAFRYQNYLDSLLDRTTNFLSSNAVLMKITAHHYKKKANPEAENETIETGQDLRPVDCEANDLIDFLYYVYSEKEKLSNAISKAKAECGIDIDLEIANNRVKQRIAAVMQRMGSTKSSERIVTGSDYKFNVEGNQVKYFYEIKEVFDIDFDRNKVKAIAKEMSKKADTVSATIDKIMVSVEVDYEIPFDVNGTYEDAMEVFISNKK